MIDSYAKRLEKIMYTPHYQHTLVSTTKMANDLAFYKKKYGVTGFNKPKRTPQHATKSHIVVAKSNGRVKVIRFGQQGVNGSPKKKGESEAYRKRRIAFKKRHAKNIALGRMSAAWWADKVKW